LRFTVRRPPTGEVSPCGHRPSGGNIACSVDVGIAPSGSAGFALENRLTLAVPGSDVPARGASLRRVRSRNLLDSAQSLMLQARDELAPATSSDRAVEPTFLGHSCARLLDAASCRPGHRPHVEVLDAWPARSPAAPAAGPYDSRREATRTRRGPRSIARPAPDTREPCGPVASAAAAPPPNSTHTARPGSAPTVPAPAQGSATVETATYPHRNHRHR
jgi:hypothetical protein